MGILLAFYVFKVGLEGKLLNQTGNFFLVSACVQTEGGGDVIEDGFTW